MAKGKKQTNSLKSKIEAEQTTSAEQQTVVPVVDKASKQNKPAVKKVKAKEKKPNRFIKKIKDTFSELKRVSWPTFFKVVKKTGVVLAVVLIFAAVLFGIDRLLSWLFSLLTGI